LTTLYKTVWSRAFFSGEISPDVSKSDEPAVVPPKSGQCSKAGKGDTGPKKKPWYGVIPSTHTVFAPDVHGAREKFFHDILN